MNLGLLILIGVPSSGKTTLAKVLKTNFKEYSGSGFQFIHVCYDKLIPFEVQSTEIQWKISRNLLAGNIEKLVTSIKGRKRELCPEIFITDYDALNDLDQNVILIIDDNMYYKSMRYTLYQIAKRHTISFCQLFLNCSLSVALMKNSERDPSLFVPPEIIEKMYHRLEPPNTNNNWEVFSVMSDAFSNTKDLFHDLFPVLMKSLENPVLDTNEFSEDDKEMSVLQCKRNLVHQADLALRRIVNDKFQELLTNATNSLDKKQISSELKMRKSEIMHDVKAGNIFFSDDIHQEINDDDRRENIQLIRLLCNYF